MIELTSVSKEQIETAPFNIDVQRTVLLLLKRAIKSNFPEDPNRISRVEAEQVLLENPSLSLNSNGEVTLVPQVIDVLDTLFANAISVSIGKILERAPINPTTKRETLERAPYTKIEKDRNLYRVARLKQLGPVLSIFRAKYKDDFEVFFDPETDSLDISNKLRGSDSVQTTEIEKRLAKLITLILTNPERRALFLKEIDFLTKIKSDRIKKELKSENKRYVPIVIIGAGVHGVNLAQELLHRAPRVADASITFDESDVAGGQFRKLSIYLNSRGKPSIPGEYASLPTGIDGNINPLGEYSTTEVSGFSSTTFPTSQELGDATAVNAFFASNVALRTKHIRTVPTTSMNTSEYESTFVDLDTGEQFTVYSDIVIGTSGNGSIRYGVEKYLQDGTSVIDKESQKAITISQGQIDELQARLDQGQEFYNLKPEEIPAIMTQVEAQTLFARPEFSRPLEYFTEDLGVIGGADGMWTTLEWLTFKSPAEYGRSVHATDSVRRITVYGAPGLTAEDLEKCRKRYAPVLLDFARRDGRPGKVSPVLEKAQQFRILENGPNAGKVEVTYFNSETLQIETAIHNHVIVAAGYESSLRDQFKEFETTDARAKPTLKDFASSIPNVAAALTIPGSQFFSDGLGKNDMLEVLQFDAEKRLVTVRGMYSSPTDGEIIEAQETIELTDLLDQLTRQGVVDSVKIPENSCSIFNGPSPLERIVNPSRIAQAILVDGLTPGTVIEVNSNQLLITYKVIEVLSKDPIEYKIETKFTQNLTSTSELSALELLSLVTTDNSITEYKLLKPPEYTQLSNAILTPGSSLFASSTEDGTDAVIDLLTIAGPPDFSDPNDVLITITTSRPDFFAPDDATVSGNSFTAPLDAVFAKLKTLRIDSITVPTPPSFVKSLSPLVVQKNGLDYSVGRKVADGIIIAGAAAQLPYSPYEIKIIPQSLLNVLNGQNIIAMWRLAPQVTELARQWLLGGDGSDPARNEVLDRIKRRIRTARTVNSTALFNNQLYPQEGNLQIKPVTQDRLPIELERGFDPKLNVRDLLRLRLNHYLQNIDFFRIPFARYFGSVEGKPIGQIVLTFSRQYSGRNERPNTQFSVTSDTPIPNAFGAKLLADKEFCRLLERVMPPAPRQGKEQRMSITIPLRQSEKNISPLPELMQINTLDKRETSDSDRFSRMDTNIRGLLNDQSINSFRDAITFLEQSDLPENAKQRLQVYIASEFRRSFDTFIDATFTYTELAADILEVINSLNSSEYITFTVAIRLINRLHERTVAYVTKRASEISTLRQLMQLLETVALTYNASTFTEVDAELREQLRAAFTTIVRRVLEFGTYDFLSDLQLIKVVSDLLLEQQIYDTPTDLKRDIAKDSSAYYQRLNDNLAQEAKSNKNNNQVLGDLRSAIKILAEVGIVSPLGLMFIDRRFVENYSAPLRLIEKIRIYFNPISSEYLQSEQTKEDN